MGEGGRAECSGSDPQLLKLPFNKDPLSYLGCALFKPLMTSCLPILELQQGLFLSLDESNFSCHLKHSYESKDRVEKSCGHEITPISGSTRLVWNSYSVQTHSLPLSSPSIPLTKQAHPTNHQMVQIFEVQVFSLLLLPPPCGLIKPLSHLTCGQELTLTSLVALLLLFHSLLHTAPRMVSHTHTHTLTHATHRASSYYSLASVTFLRENPNAYIVSRQFKI